MPSPSAPQVSPTTARITGGPAAPSLSAVEFADARHGWAGGDGVIVGTHDGGATWQVEWRGLETILELRSVDGRTVWAIGASGSPETSLIRDTLLRTTDGGAHWSSTHLPRSLGALDIHSALEAWAIGPRVGSDPTDYYGAGPLLHTTDGGRTWTTAIASAVGAVCFADATDGWAAGARVLRTADGGRTWSPISATPTLPAGYGAMPSALGCADPAALWLFRSLDGGAGGHLDYAGYRSFDGGAHWREVLGNPFYPSTPRGIGAAADEPGPFEAPDGVHAIELGFRPAANVDSVTVTADGGQTWSQVPLEGIGLGAAALAAPDPADLWVAGSTWGFGGFLLGSADGGRTWRERWPVATPRPTAAIAFVSPSEGFGVGVPGDARAVLHTQDGGVRWELIAELPSPVEAFAGGAFELTFTDDAHGWAATASGHLLATADGGRTWRQMPDPPGTSRAGGARPFNEVAFADELDGCVSSQTALGIPSSYVTSDGGRTWRQVESMSVLACAHGKVGASLLSSAAALPSTVTPMLAAVVDPSDGWAILDRAVAVTHDGGATWATILWPAPLPTFDPLAFSGPAQLSFVNASDGWILANDGRLYRTVDGGQSWVQTP